MADGQVEFIPFSDPRLGRHVRHDPRNRNFALPRQAPPDTDIRHRNYGRKLNQKSVGACTCFAGAHAANAGPVRAARRPLRLATADDALRWYSRATHLDPFEGVYPPTDTGSSGQAACQAMMEEGVISRYEWAFGYEHGLTVLRDGPLMQGSWWTWDMMTPDADGRVRATGADAGGHEVVWMGYEIRSKLSPSQNRSWFLNSWWDKDRPWGKGGYFYMTAEDHAPLLARNGDLVRPS